MFQEGYMAYLQGWSPARIAGFIEARTVKAAAGHPETEGFIESRDFQNLVLEIEDFLDGHAAAARENSNAI